MCLQGHSKANLFVIYAERKDHYLGIVRNSIWPRAWEGRKIATIQGVVVLSLGLISITSRCFKSCLDLVTNAHRTRNKLARTKTKDQCWLSKCANYILGLQTSKCMLNFSFLGLCSLFLQWLFSNNVCACCMFWGGGCRWP